MTSINVETAKTSELVAFYNANVAEGKQVKKFVNRATAQRRVQALVDELAQTAIPFEESSESGAEEAAEDPIQLCPNCGIDVGDNGFTLDSRTGDTICLVCGHGGSSKSTTRSEAQRIAWKNQKTKTTRSRKHRVMVDGEEYRSVKQAFEFLNLPLQKHIKFRGELKREGEVNAYGFNWKLVEDA